MFVGDWPAARARFSPGETALRDLAVNRDHSFSSIARRAAKLTFFLFRRLKVNKGDRVALLSENRICGVELFFASAKIGAISDPAREIPMGKKRPG